MYKTNKTESLPPEANGFTSTQIDLFQNFLDDMNSDQLSNTIELWDAVPKYAFSTRNRMRRNGLLESVRLSFCHRGSTYDVVIQPARIETPSGSLETFPGEREEIVEDALRKLAAGKGQGFCDRHGPGVIFTSKQVCRLLDEHRHGIRCTHLSLSLQILLGTRIFISRTGEKKSFFASTIITELGAVSREDWRRDSSAKWYARFNSLIEGCILAKTYRQFDFARMMSHSSQIARWLYKRMAHLYLQASIDTPYRILLATIKRDSMLLNASSLRYDARSIEKSLKEMKQHRVLIDVQEDRRYGPRRMLIDVLYTLTPHPEFIRQIKAANKRTRMLLMQAETAKYANQSPSSSR